eukprot:TRINITY_DN2211_c0_g2_i1.p2 TRINITY_DN2211_c0_g2~~TRINITY_DN2211_c0_g2_i1.p2  ORF type:complete len:522 (+),score=123.34 TRINITY_DN2211_c0_g2_i1:194-1759(+)
MTSSGRSSDERPTAPLGGAAEPWEKTRTVSSASAASILNPHKAMAMAVSQTSPTSFVGYPRTGSPMTSFNGVPGPAQGIKSPAGASPLIGHVPTAPNGMPGAMLGDDWALAMPGVVPRSRTSSRSERQADNAQRRCRIQDSFVELERLLRESGSRGALPKKLSKVEIIEASVAHIAALQRKVNAAGDRNSQLHDVVDNLQQETLPDPVEASQTSPPPAADEPFVTLPPQRNFPHLAFPAEPPLDEGVVTQLKSLNLADVLMMVGGGLVAHCVPTEWQSAAAAPSPAAALRVVLHLGGVLRWCARVGCLVACAAACVYLTRKHRNVRSGLRWALTRLLSVLGDGGADAGAAASSPATSPADERPTRPPTALAGLAAGGRAPEQPQQRRASCGWTSGSRSQASSSSSSFPSHGQQRHKRRQDSGGALPRKASAAALRRSPPLAPTRRSPRGGARPTQFPGSLAPSHMRKIWSADNFEVLEEAAMPRVPEPRVRAISNPVHPVKPAGTKPIMLNHHQMLANMCR